MARVLIVEDEPLIAIDLACTLEAAGHEILGPFNTAASAISGMAEDTPDIALLDWKLDKGDTSEQVANELDRRVVPYAYLSGYALPDQDERTANSVFIGKPICHIAVLSHVEKLLQMDGSQSTATSIPQEPGPA